MKKISYSQIYIDDGLGDLAKERYARRRQHLVNLVDGLIVLVGLQNPPERDYEWQLNYFLYQDPLFLYLTGINQLKTALIIDPYNDETILF